MRTSDEQVRLLMQEKTKHGKVGKAAMKAGMDRKTARKYIKAGKLPSEMNKPHTWRTREDPFAEVWPKAEEKLKEIPELTAKELFEWLMGKYPGQFQEGQLRTFQRRVRQWRAQSGPPKEVFFAQEHRPGEAMQTDFTHVKEFEVRIGGEVFEHMLCHVVLPYSNWEWVTVCHSESMSALKRGVQQAVFQLGKVPQYHQTDNSTAATHKLKKGGKRGFNKEYEEFMAHFGMVPRTIAVGQSNQNGDVEVLNGALKRRLHQRLLLRGNADFESVAEYESWIQEVTIQANKSRKDRVGKEMQVMRQVRVSKLPEFKEEDVRVSSRSTIRVKFNTYSVPSRLIGEMVHIRLYEDRLEVFYKGKRQMSIERLRGRHGHRIEYRHVIDSLMQKPGAFARYKYREDLFPSLSFRKAYDALKGVAKREMQADIEYLRLLHLASKTMESDVETAINLLMEGGDVPYAEQVKALVAPREPEIPEITPYHPELELQNYDAFLGTNTQQEAS